MSQAGRFFTDGQMHAIEFIEGNSGGPVGPDGAETIFILGDTTTINVVGNPGTNTLTISAVGSVATSYVTDSGIATPLGNVLDILGGIGLTTTGATNVVTVDLDIPVTVPHGGTGVITMTTAYAPVCAGTTATGPLQVASTGLATSGFVLTSTGAASLPTFQAPSASSISITGDSGGALTGSAFTFTGGTTGLTFAGLVTTETLSGTLNVGHGGTGATTLTGVLTGNGTSAFTASAVTQFNVLVGGASNTITSIAPTATVGIPLVSAGAAVNPVFGTAVVAGGGTGNTTFTAYSVITAGTTSTGAFQNVSGVGTSGQVLTSNGAGALPTWQAGGATGITWTVITADQTAAVNNGYICNKGSALLLALPTTAATGSIIEVTGMNTALGWKITQASGQQIHFGTADTTSGAAGFLQSTAIRDSIRIVCVVANNEWNVLSVQGNVTVA